MCHGGQLRQHDGEKDARTKGEERIVAKSKSTAMNLSSIVPTSSSSAKSPIASKSPGTLTATEKLESKMRIGSESDAASSSQVRLQDAYLRWLMDKATEKSVHTHPHNLANCGLAEFGLAKCGQIRMAK